MKICNLQHLVSGEGSFPLSDQKQKTKVTFVNRSKLIARPFVPSAQFSSFVPFCHSRGTSFYRPSSTNFLTESFLFFARDFPSSQSTPDITVSLLFFASAGSLFSTVAKEMAVLLQENATSALLRCTWTILPMLYI